MSCENEENTKNSKHEERATKGGTMRAQSVSPAAVKRPPERGGGVETFFDSFFIRKKYLKMTYDIRSFIFCDSEK